MDGQAHTSTHTRIEPLTRSVFAIQMPLDGNGSVLVDGKLATTIRSSIDGERNFALASLIRIVGSESLQTLADFGVFVDGRLDVGFVEQRLVVVDVAQLDVHPTIGNVILVVAIVLALLCHAKD